MKLEKCRVQNYRCIIDSGWVELDDMMAVVGRNESGKTSFLRALWRLNPHQNVRYDINREWPVEHRQEESLDKVVVQAVFSFSEEERTEISEIHESARNIEKVRIGRNYSGEYSYKFTPENPKTEHNVEWLISLLRSNFDPITSANIDKTPESLSQKYASVFATLASKVQNKNSDFILKHLVAVKNELKADADNAQTEEDRNMIASLMSAIDEVTAEIKRAPRQHVINYVHEHMPTFIYMDDYRIFAGSAKLDEVLKHQEEKSLKPEEETTIIIMELAGLDLAQEVQKGSKGNPRQRKLDMDDASHTLTKSIADRWSQRKYEVELHADSQHFMTFIKDSKSRGAVSLEDCSKGFQWFFSFDMHFMHGTGGAFSNAILLLDEPGLHLHAAAQKDLLKRMKAYAQESQLIYTTHLPFMIDPAHLNNIVVAEEIDGEGTKIHANWATADKDARFTLQAALGLSWSQSLFVGNYNLVVEGVDDFWFLTTFSALLEEAGKTGLDPDLVVTPAGGASKVAYVGTILHGQDLHVAVMLDSDSAGEQAFEQLVHQWILDEKLVVMVGGTIGVNPCALEDLFNERYYISKVEEVYSDKLFGEPIKLNPNTAERKTLVQRIEYAFKEKQNQLGKFNKGRVAKQILKDLAGNNLDAMSRDTVANFEKLIGAINEVVAQWKK